LDALHALASRVSGDSKPDLGAATGVINDVGRALAAAPVQDLRIMQAAIASLRERLQCGDSVVQCPAVALNSPEAGSYLAGALWAADDILSSCLAARARAAERISFMGRQQTLRELILTMLRNCKQITPADVVSSAKSQGLQVRPDQVSKALSELLSRGFISVAPSPTDADRRTHYFELTGVED